MASVNCLVTHVLQTIFFCIQQKKEIHTGIQSDMRESKCFLGELKGIIIFSENLSLTQRIILSACTNYFQGFFLFSFFALFGNFQGMVTLYNKVPFANISYPT